MASEHWTSEELEEALKVIWNEVAIPDEQLNFKDDHIISWYLGHGGVYGSLDEHPLYIQVLHAGMHKFWGTRQNEILVVVLTERSAEQFEKRVRLDLNGNPRIKWDPRLRERFKRQNEDRNMASSGQTGKLPRNYGNNTQPAHQAS